VNLKEEAKRFYDWGFNVVAFGYGPPDADGKVSKKPLVEWQKWQTERQTLEEFEAQPWDRADGFAVICSYPNRFGYYLAVVDYDTKNVNEEAKERGRELLKRFPVTWMEKTVSGGLHLIYLSRVKPSAVSEYHDSHALELVAGAKPCVLSPSRGYLRLNDNAPMEVEDAEALFYQVLGVRDKRQEVNEGVSSAILQGWLKQIKPKLNIAGEGSQYLYVHCPFHKPDNHPSFAIHKAKFYAIDYHDNRVYSLKELAQALGVTLPGAEISGFSLNGHRVEVQGKTVFLYDRQGRLIDSFKAHLLNTKAFKQMLSKVTGLDIREVNRKIAAFLLKQRRTEEKTEEAEEPEPCFDVDWLILHPALDVKDGKAYIGVDLPCKIKREDGSEELRDYHFLITSDREKIICMRENLNNLRIKLEHTVVSFPLRWSLQSIKEWLKGKASVEPKTLYEKVRDGFKRHMEFDDDVIYDFLTLWDIGTYFFILFNAYPYLYIGGMKRVGKTKLLTLFRCTAFNAIFSGNMTTAALFRLVQSGRCTTLLDETEKLNSPEKLEDFRNLLLNGYKRSGLVWRVNKDTGRPEPYEVYAPKAIANIKGLEDVLEDRCITIILKRGKNPDIINREVDEFSHEWQEIRDMLYVFMLERFSELNELSDECELYLERAKEIRERERELWKPILVLAKYFEKWIPGLYDKILDFAKKKVREKQIENMTETGEYILVQTLLKIVDKDGFYKVKNIKDAMLVHFEEPQNWLTTKWVGNALRRLGFTEKRRIGTGYEYRLNPSSIKDLAERLNIEVKNAEKGKKQGEPDKPSGDGKKGESEHAGEHPKLDREETGKEAEKGVISEANKEIPPRALLFYIPSPSSSHSSLNTLSSLVEVYDALRKNLTEPFDKPYALSMIAKFRGCNFEEAERIFKILVDEGKIGLYGKGLWFWT